MFILHTVEVLMHCFFVDLAVAIAMFIIKGRGEGEGRGGGGEDILH